MSGFDFNVEKKYNIPCCSDSVHKRINKNPNNKNKKFIQDFQKTVF